MIDLDNVRLGKKLGVVEDPRTFMASAIMRVDEMPKIPLEHGIARNTYMVPVFGNDVYGNCTQASKGHAVICFEKSSQQWAGQKNYHLKTEDVMTAYQRIGGYIPGKPETDNGAYELDSMNDWRQNGIGTEKDGTPHKIYAFVRVDHQDHDEVRRAHYLFGGLKVCAALPLSAADQISDGKIWDVTEGDRNKWGSWGGHSMYSPRYFREGPEVFTWGDQQKMTWSWWDHYVDEVYAVISEDYLRIKSGNTPQGFDLERLNKMLAYL